MKNKYDYHAAVSKNSCLKPVPASPDKRGMLVAFFFSTLLLFFSGALSAQYIVDFEGTGETKTGYASGTVNLSSLDWDMTEALIGTSASDWKNGARSARMRGYGESAMTMLEDKTGGAGNVTFQYRRFGTDQQVAWRVEYSTDQGQTWTQLGNDFTAPASNDVQTFSEDVDTPDDIRIRISSVATTGADNRRLNIDDITITDFVAQGSPVISASPTTLNLDGYQEGSGPSTSGILSVSGEDMTGDISFSQVSNFEFSFDDVNFFPSLPDLEQFGGIIPNTEYFVRLQGGLTAGQYTEQLTLSSPGANDVVVTLSAEVTGVPQGLIISQHVETDSGTTPKGIELWNQTGASLDFSTHNLVILQGTNGNTPIPAVTISSGTLDDGEVMVVGTADIGTHLTAQGLGSVLFVPFNFTFNGNDALVIQLNGVVEDTFGEPGVDPGVAWEGNGVSTRDSNIQLICDITTGAPEGWSDPSIRFENVGGGQDLTGFGVPPQPCSAPQCSIDEVTFANVSACDLEDNSYTADITVTYTNDPGGNLVVNGQIFAVTSSPQTVELTLDSDGLDVDVEVSFALNPSCSFLSEALFTAPQACVIPEPECGNESFSNMGAGNSGSYLTYNYVGDDGYDITITDARNDQTINGRAATIRNGSATVQGAIGGIGDLTLTTQRKFAGGAGNLTVEVNGNPVGTIPYDATIQTTTISGINVPGTVNIEIINPNIGNDRVAIDDLIWTCFSAPGIQLSPISGNTDESGTTATFDVTLTEEPASDVVLTVTSGDITENTVAPSTLTFDASNWDIPQTVTVTGVPDGIIDGDQTTTITVAVDDAQSDPSYHGLFATIDVINEDIDACDEPVWEVVNITTNSSFNNGGAWTPIPGGFSANGFCGGGCQEDVDTWLVFGPLDLSSSTSLNLLFDASESFGTTDLTIQYSTDYALSPCPLWATWSGQTLLTDPGAIDIDLSGAAGQSGVYIGIAYTTDGSTGYSSWSLTNFEIVSDVCPTVGTPVVSDCTIPAPANNECADAQSLSVPAWP
ncbi:MAG: hypothetical protein EA392_00810, partial [Cryomorphaceae bacterium]